MHSEFDEGDSMRQELGAKSDDAANSPAIGSTAQERPAAAERLDGATVRRLYQEHARELQRFLLGILRDPQAASDAMQAALVKAIEQGHTARDETRKAWLFRVAYHEALAVRRREATGERILKAAVWNVRARERPAGSESAAESASRREEAAAVRDALAGLSAELQAVVRLRIHENFTFAEIAARLEIPLGTALTRMRTALGKLKTALDEYRP